MQTDSSTAMDDLLAQLDSATAELPEFDEDEERQRFCKFLRRYYEGTTPDTLRMRVPQALLATALGHWRYVYRRSDSAPMLRVLPATSDNAYASVETCVDDLPFLVDSISLCIHDHGANIDWLVHPVLRLRRDASGRIVEIDSDTESSNGERRESLIHVEFGPLADASAYLRLEHELRDTLDDLAGVVSDYPAMRQRLHDAAVTLQYAPPQSAAESAECRAFLDWLDDGHFTFLGCQDIDIVAGREGNVLQPLASSGLGLLRDGCRFVGSELLAPQPELDRYVESSRVVVVNKSEQRSPIHNPAKMDVISVRRFDAHSRPVSISRFIGLFSSDVYIDRPRHIPLIRRKADEVMKRARLIERSHAGKLMRDVLQQLPRDELFQCGEDDLYRICVGIHALADHHPLRLFMRRGRYGRFYSCLVYLSRERYSEDLRDHLAAELKTIFDSDSIDPEVAVLRNGRTRIQFIVHTPPGTQMDLDERALEARLRVIARSWRDRLGDTLRAQQPQLAVRFIDAFPLSYAEASTPDEAVADADCLARLSATQPLLPRLMLNATGGTALKLYAMDAPIALSDVLPTLKHFGLRALRQTPVEISPAGSGQLWVQRFEIEAETGSVSCGPAALQARSADFESAFLAVWRGEVENDGLNRLVLCAGLDARQVTLLRAVCKYLVQTGLPYSQSYMIGLLAEHAAIATLLLRLFETRMNPDTDTAVRETAEQALATELDQALDQVSSLDADRVLRAFLSVIRATLRSNYFQPDAQGNPKTWISLKLDPARIPELPLPRPMFETWVYAPQVEGIHLRGGLVARGGLRWSDRAQDFRTEVLGLMKAQMVKNAVIVPVGAKGGFVVKRAVDPADRDAWLAAGQECYKIFLRGLLNLTDNRVGDAIVPPLKVLRHDGDDPYLVVAADKGTASFSDLANGVAAEYGFWLGDAFASGGSAGYDHKKMGITARGTWESVKCHFREIGVDIRNQPFTCVGIGDMSGDVFGNGMLLSKHLRLIAAFDHRHIFIDPDPAAASFDERKRLFVLPRSSWADYGTSLISAGGGVWPRSAKSITLAEPARRALGTDVATLTPMELIRAILRAPVDLLWNGGIGTYVKAHPQSNETVGDRSDDALRVDARELRCKVVGEGGNLGFTQAGRVEYALAGGRINTDAIDNAGGVHTSDREVNLKIPLNQLMHQGALNREQRDPLLAACTDDIAKVVLYDNYLQATAISVQMAEARGRLDDHLGLIRMLEHDGLLKRSLEGLPDDDSIRERRAAGLGLVRPELAILTAYAKISLKQAALASELPDDPYFVHELLENFPTSLVERFRAALQGHRLRREIVATILANAAVNRMGPAFVHLQADDHGLSRAEVLKGYATARQVFGGDAYWQAIEAYDYQLPAALQYRLMRHPSGLIKHVTVWFATSTWSQRPIAEAVERFNAPVAQIAAMLPDALPPAYREDWQQTVDRLSQEQVPQALAERLADTRALGGATDIVELAEAAAASLAETAAAYYLCGERFSMLWLYAAINELPTDGRWQALARVNLRDDAYRIHRQLAGRVLLHPGASPQARLEHWFAAHRDAIERSERRLAEIQADGNPDFMALAVAVREVRKLRLLS